MSATGTMDGPAPGGTAGAASGAGVAGRDHAPGLARLTRVELRKMVDTRAGFWLLATLAAITVAVVTIVAIVGDDADRTFERLFAVSVEPSAILLPVVGVLLVTSEWTQRTTLITFALVPRRGRVLVAKLLAGVAISLTALVLCALASAIATAAASAPDAWSLRGAVSAQLVLYVVTATLGGVALGAAILSSAPAIVLLFVLPLAFAALGSWSAIEPVAEWLDATRSVAPMTEDPLSATEWARAGTTLLAWTGIPLAVGWWRITRGEVR